MEHTTVADPAPMPETALPKDRVKIENAVDSTAEPRASAKFNAIIAGRRPYLAATAPDPRAPNKPPKVKADCMSPHWPASIGMQAGNVEDFGVDIAVSLVLQVMTASGAFSSPRWYPNWKGPSEAVKRNKSK
jgi:hypothetical protein